MLFTYKVPVEIGQLGMKKNTRKGHFMMPTRWKEGGNSVCSRDSMEREKGLGISSRFTLFYCGVHGTRKG